MTKRAKKSYIFRQITKLLSGAHRNTSTSCEVPVPEKHILNFVFCLWQFADDLEISESDSDHSEDTDDSGSNNAVNEEEVNMEEEILEESQEKDEDEQEKDKQD